LALAPINKSKGIVEFEEDKIFSLDFFQAQYEIFENFDSKSLNPFGAGGSIGLTITTPLFQINFFPDLVQVKVFPDATDLIPTVLQLDPALTAACTGFKFNKNLSWIFI
jgi:hypothetical protein